MTRSNDDGFAIRVMEPSDIDLAIEWAAHEGWNPGLTDAASFWAADPGGFLIGELAGEPVAVISAVRYGERYGFVGLYIVKPEWRGQRYGIAVWQAAMQRLQGRVVGLDGVVAQQDNYRRSGFGLAHRNARYAGVKTAAASNLRVPVPDSVVIAPLANISAAMVTDYDREFFPEPRDAFVRAWIAQPGTLAWGAVASGAAPALRGYGVLRPCREGFKIGPLFADSPDVAAALFGALVEQVPSGRSYYLDVMQTNPPAIDLATRNGMQIVFETARMYTGPAPDISAERTYGITSFELG